MLPSYFRGVQLLLLMRPCAAKVVVAAVLPHGDFVYDPSLIHGANGSTALHGNATLLAQAITAARPDLLFLTTPHGLEDTHDFLLYQNSAAAGVAHVGQDLHNASFPTYDVHLSANASRPAASALVEALRGHAHVSGLLAFADAEPIALRWGEVIPLSFLAPLLRSAPLLTCSIPTRRLAQSGAPMTAELLRLGGALSARLEAMPHRVALLTSADLAHTHLPSGPYGYSAAAAPFDAAVGRWAATLHDEPLLSAARALVPRALSCGYPGLVLLHGMLTRASVFAAREWRPMEKGPFALAHPTYYGMLVAGFEREGSADRRARRR